MKLLDGKVAVITGAGGGLGRSHALAFAAQGAKVVVNDPGVSRDGSGQASGRMADAVVEEIKKSGGQAVGHYESIATTAGAESLIQTALEAFGRVDILVNNAGILRDKTILKMDDDMWDAVLAVHLRGTFLCTRAAARVMKEKATGGRIINTTSIAGLKGNFGQSNYGAAKAGIYGFTMTSAMELQKEGITVNAIAPIAKTRMTEDIESIPAEYRAEDVSPVVVFLASDLAKDVTGRVFGVHGRHLFEYRMENTAGKEKKEAWTPQEISDFIHAPPEAPKPAAAPTGGSPIAALFQALPSAFDAEKSAGWDTLMHFAVAGAGDWTVEVKNKTLRVAEGKPADAPSVITVDADTLMGMVEGRIKGDMAFMSGKLKATKVPDLAKFGKVFDFKKLKIAPAPAASGKPDSQIGLLFKALAAGFDAEKSAGWDTLMHFAIAGAGDWAVEVKNKTLRVAEGNPADAPSVITTDADTLMGMVEGRIKGDMAFMSGKLKATKVPDLAKFGKVFDFKKILAAAQVSQSAPVGAAPAAKPTAVDVASLLQRLPSQFLPDKAAGFSGSYLFKVDGQAATLEIKDGKAAVRPPSATATCTITTDGATLNGLLDGTVDPQKALSEGKLKATHLPSLIKLRQSFKWEPEKGLHRALIGRLYTGAPILVRPERIAAFGDVVGDPESPVFPVSLVKQPFMKLFQDPDFNGDFSRMVHGEQLIVVHRPIRAWDLVSPRAKVLSIDDKGSGQLMTVGQTLYAEGEKLVEMESRLFFRGESKGEKSPAPPPPAKPKPDRTFEIATAQDLPKRYAVVSGDDNPIHLDENLAKSVGFKGVILHGLSTLALVAGKLPKPLTRLEVRFNKPVYPGEVLTTSVWNKGDLLEFETANAAGEIVLANGKAVAKL